MLKSYEAIYDHGRIRWLGEAPRFKRVRVVLVADDANELSEADLSSSTQTNGSSFVEFLQSIPPEVRARFAEKFGDLVAWQREQRREIPPIESSKILLNDSQADVLLAETAGAWGKHSLDEIEAMIAEQRRQDWGEE